MGNFLQISDLTRSVNRCLARGRSRLSASKIIAPNNLPIWLCISCLNRVKSEITILRTRGALQLADHEQPYFEIIWCLLYKSFIPSSQGAPSWYAILRNFTVRAKDGRSMSPWRARGSAYFNLSLNWVIVESPMNSKIKLGHWIKPKKGKVFGSRTK